jgi:sulfate transport system substrate-binding protein
MRWIAPIALALAAACSNAAEPGAALLNVSYDPTRELYVDVDAAFARDNPGVVVNQSHGGSSKQARAVLDGLEADVVTLALARDVDVIAERSDLLAKDWRARLPNGSVPWTSTIVFVVRAGNPKSVRDWPDLVRDGVEVVTPNPKTSGGARYNYLAAWAHGRESAGADASDAARDDKARAFVSDLYAHVRVLDTGARGATTTFAERGIGDVLLAWESEALLLADEDARAQQRGEPKRFEIVVPPLSIVAEPPVALVDKNVDKHGTRALAEKYLQFLFSDEGQALGVKHHYRPTSTSSALRERADGKFAALRLVRVDDVAGGWTNAQRVHFDDAGVFDSLAARIGAALEAR